jgi:hypothetical protein
MSGTIPELDRLIEESENVRNNKKYRRQDRIFKISMMLMLFSFPLFLISTLIFGVNIGSIIVSCCFLASITPMILECFFDLKKEFLKDNWKNVDMTKRYVRK